MHGGMKLFVSQIPFSVHGEEHRTVLRQTKTIKSVVMLLVSVLIVDVFRRRRPSVFSEFYFQTVGWAEDDCRIQWQCLLISQMKQGQGSPMTRLFVEVVGLDAGL